MRDLGRDLGENLDELVPAKEISEMLELVDSNPDEEDVEVGGLSR